MNEKIIQEYTKLGQNVDQVFLKQEMDWICEKLLKILIDFKKTFHQLVQPITFIVLKLMMIGQMVFGQECYGWHINIQKMKLFMILL